LGIGTVTRKEVKSRLSPFGPFDELAKQAFSVYTCIYMFIIDLCKQLASDEVEFAIAGGYACVLHGVVRGTVDVDIVLALTAKNFQAAEKSLERLGLKSRLPLKAQEVFQFRKEYIEKRSLVAWSFVDFKDPSRVVDILIINDSKKMRIIKKKIVGVAIPVISLRDLIKMKKKAGRPQDIEDLKLLEVINEKS
jgi:hypothetical protein